VPRDKQPENFPRGRVVFDTRNQRFTSYADKQLRTAARPDLHYRSSLDRQLEQDRKQ
jgi:hypothetical protein